VKGACSEDWATEAPKDINQINCMLKKHLPKLKRLSSASLHFVVNPM
jgi:hypothetical protein